MIVYLRRLHSAAPVPDAVRLRADNGDGSHAAGARGGSQRRHPDGPCSAVWRCHKQPDGVRQAPSGVWGKIAVPPPVMVLRNPGIWCFFWPMDPVSGVEHDPDRGSGMNILDPQHCRQFCIPNSKWSALLAALWNRNRNRRNRNLLTSGIGTGTVIC